MRLRELRHNLWNIGFVEEGLEDTLKAGSLNIHWVRKRFRDRWFADPFILDVTDTEIIILAEEWSYNLRCGRLARVVIDRHTYEEKHFDIILDLPTHLSFPFIYRKGGRVYVMPENSASGCSTIYEYVNGTLKPAGQVSGKPLTDATIFHIDSHAYLATTMVPDPNGKTLSIYDFDEASLTAGARRQTATFPTNTARNAGECFTVGGILYRPAQDCTDCYGHGVQLQRVGFDGQQWTFTPVSSFYPCSFRYNQGLHTFNNYKGLIVIDSRGYRFPIIGRILTFLLSLIGKK